MWPFSHDPAVANFFKFADDVIVEVRRCCVAPKRHGDDERAGAAGLRDPRGLTMEVRLEQAKPELSRARWHSVRIRVLRRRDDGSQAVRRRLADLSVERVS